MSNRNTDTARTAGRRGLRAWGLYLLVLTACAVLSVGSEVLAVVAAVVALAIPVAYGRLRSAKVSG